MNDSPIRPKAHLDSCSKLFRFWIIAAMSPPFRIQKTIHMAIIGGGIGVALAVACLHRGFRLPFTNAITASARSQGYGLTLQQASKASKDWVFSLEKEFPPDIWFILQMEK
jgi:hypothetical protein